MFELCTNGGTTDARLKNAPNACSLSYFHKIVIEFFVIVFQLSRIDSILFWEESNYKVKFGLLLLCWFDYLVASLTWKSINHVAVIYLTYEKSDTVSDACKHIVWRWQLTTVVWQPRKAFWVMWLEVYYLFIVNPKLLLMIRSFYWPSSRLIANENCNLIYSDFILFSSRVTFCLISSTISALSSRRICKLVNDDWWFIKQLKQKSVQKIT